MDNIPTGNDKGTPQTSASGEIYSAYSQTQSIEPQTANENIPIPSVSGGENFQNAGFPTNTDGNYTPPPMVQENNFIKIIIVLLVILILGGGAFFAYKFFQRKAIPAPKQITLTYWGLFEDKELIQPIIDEYIRSHPNTTINYIKQDQKIYRERLQAALNRGEGPDIFRIHNTWIPMFFTSLQPMPKTVYSDNEFEKIFYPVATSDLKINGNYYAMPLMIDGLVLFYNEDILKGANVPVPVTWMDVQTAAAKLTVKEKGVIKTSGIALGTAENIEHFSDILGLMMMQNGVDLSKSLFKCVNPKTTNCAVEALSFYRSFAEKPNNIWDETMDNSILAFAGGKTAMIFAPSWQIFSIKSMNPNLNFKIAKVPQLPCEQEPCKAINWATYWVEGVSNKSKNPIQAWEFLKYLSEEPNMKKMYELQIKQRQLFGEPYSRVDLANTLTGNQYLAPLVEEAPTMISFYLASRTQDGETGLNSGMIKYLRDAVNFLSAGGSPETAIKTTDDGFKQILTRFGIKTSAN